VPPCGKGEELPRSPPRHCAGRAHLCRVRRREPGPQAPWIGPRPDVANTHTNTCASHSHAAGLVSGEERRAPPRGEGRVPADAPPRGEGGEMPPRGEGKSLRGLRRATAPRHPPGLTRCGGRPGRAGEFRRADLNCSGPKPWRPQSHYNYREVSEPCDDGLSFKVILFWARRRGAPGETAERLLNVA
jgi:hypothetical protein